MTDNFEHEEIDMISTYMAKELKLHTTKHPYQNLIRVHVPEFISDA